MLAYIPAPWILWAINYSIQMDSWNIYYIYNLYMDMNDTFHSMDSWFDINYRGKPDANNYKQPSPIEVSDIGYTPLWDTVKWPPNDWWMKWLLDLPHDMVSFPLKTSIVIEDFPFTSNCWRVGLSGPHSWHHKLVGCEKLGQLSTKQHILVLFFKYTLVNNHGLKK